MTLSPTRSGRGFLLLEIVLALAVFGIAATGFAVALKQMGDAAHLAQSELQITRVLDSALDETLSLPTLEEGTSSVMLDEMEITTTITLLEELLNEDGQALDQMFAIHIEARWYAKGAWQERVVETWRNGKMYQP